MILNRRISRQILNLDEILLFLTKNFTLNNLAVGSYNWSVNCTDLYNNKGNSEERVLAVIPATSFTGETTDLSNVNISNITNLVIDSPNYGKISFSENIDLSSGGNLNTNVNSTNTNTNTNTKALTEEQLISIFSTGEKVEKSLRGSKPDKNVNLNENGIDNGKNNNETNKKKKKGKK